MITGEQMLLRFVDYQFALSTSGDIYMDQELDPSQLNIVTGDKFEAIIVPTVGLVFKKLPRDMGTEKSGV